MAVRGSLLLAGALLSTACGGRQSTLAPAGRAAERIADLFWVMTAAALVIWLAVLGLTLWATRAARKPDEAKAVRTLVVGGGVIFPTALLTALLLYGLGMLPNLLARAPEGSLSILVVGEQWWWRVRYLPHGGTPVDLANEIRLPAGTAVEVLLESPDVIHSFWIPALAGKMDMIPGRRTRLTLEPTRHGEFRGLCAEYCGASHALMSFPVVVQEAAEFQRWLEQQASPALPSTEPTARQGQELFAMLGCGGCHTVRGTDAVGVIGPDLTHVGSRLSLAAGTLPNDAPAFGRWLSHTDEVKPGVHMPAFGMLTPDEARALSAFLEGLK